MEHHAWLFNVFLHPTMFETESFLLATVEVRLAGLQACEASIMFVPNLPVGEWAPHTHTARPSFTWFLVI